MVLICLVLHKSCTFSLDAIELNFWSHTSFIKLFKSTVEFSVVYKYISKFDEWPDSDSLLQALEKSQELLQLNYSQNKNELENLIYIAFKMYPHSSNKSNGIYFNRDQLKLAIVKLREELILYKFQRSSSEESKVIKELISSIKKSTVEINELTLKNRELNKELSELKSPEKKQA